jgi:hypothetical protein
MRVIECIGGLKKTRTKKKPAPVRRAISQKKSPKKKAIRKA